MQGVDEVGTTARQGRGVLQLQGQAFIVLSPQPVVEAADLGFLQHLADGLLVVSVQADAPVQGIAGHGHALDQVTILDAGGLRAWVQVKRRDPFVLGHQLGLDSRMAVVPGQLDAVAVDGSLDEPGREGDKILEEILEHRVESAFLEIVLDLPLHELGALGRQVAHALGDQGLHFLRPGHDVLGLGLHARLHGLLDLSIKTGLEGLLKLLREGRHWGRVQAPRGLAVGKDQVRQP